MTTCNGAPGLSCPGDAGPPARPGDRMALVVAGHVDHGKSTLVGRLLMDTGNVPEGKLEAIRLTCDRQGRPFESAFLLDALKDEQAQGITIERTRCFLRTRRRDYLILDAPGHVEFIRNMVTGAAQADAALLVIDALEGVRENSFRHGFLLSMIGVSQIAVCVNKMDAVGYGKNAFEAIRERYSAFLLSAGIVPAGFIPVSAREGGNVVSRCSRMTWYGGATVLDQMHRFCLPPERSRRVFRMPVQDVYRIGNGASGRRLVVGRIESGTVRPGDRIVLAPSGKTATIRSLQRFQSPPLPAAVAGECVGVDLEEHVYVRRGEVMAHEACPPVVADRLRADVLWLGCVPLGIGQSLLLKIGNMETTAVVEAILRRMDPATLETSAGGGEIERHQVAECLIRLRRLIACDPHDLIPETGRFVLVSRYGITGGGIVRELFPPAEVRAAIGTGSCGGRSGLGRVRPEQRSARRGHCPALVLITGAVDARLSDLACELEHRLFLLGLDAYAMNASRHVEGHAGAAVPDPRLREVVSALLDAGLVVIATASGHAACDLAFASSVANPDHVLWVHVGEGGAADCLLPPSIATPAAAEEIVARLHDLGVVSPVFQSGHVT